MTNTFTSWLASQRELAFAALRGISGSLFAFHGVQKIFGVLATHGTPEVGSQLWIGGLIELIAGALVAVGLFTPYSAFLASGTMAVAYAQYHWGFRFDSHFFPAINDGELAAVYAFVFLFLATMGGGRLSLDRLVFGDRQP